MNSDTFDAESLIGAAGIGAVAGMRSVLAPALLSQAANTGSIDLEGTQFEVFLKQNTADLATGAAVLEIVADKLPFTPARTAPLPLIARAVSGAACGAALAAARKKDWVPGAIVGAASAVAMAFGAYLLRRSLTEDGKAPDLALAFAEDALAIALGVFALRNEANQTAAIAKL